MLRELSIRQYEVVPVSKQAGIVRWVHNCDTLHTVCACACTQTCEHTGACASLHVNCSDYVLMLCQMIENYRKSQETPIPLALEVMAMNEFCNNHFDTLPIAKKVGDILSNPWRRSSNIYSCMQMMIVESHKTKQNANEGESGLRFRAKRILLE